MREVLRLHTGLTGLHHRMERRNQLPAPPERVQSYRNALADVAARPVLPREDAPAATEEALAALRELGYATATPRAIDLPDPLHDTGRPAPAGRVDELRSFLEGAIEIDLADF